MGGVRPGGTVRVASCNSCRRICSLHVKAALRRLSAGRLDRTRPSTCCAANRALRGEDPPALRPKTRSGSSALLAAQKAYRLAEGGAQNEAGMVASGKDGAQMAPSTVKRPWWSWVAGQAIDPHQPIHGLRDSFGTWVYEEYGVKQAQE